MNDKYDHKVVAIMSNINYTLSEVIATPLLENLHDVHDWNHTANVTNETDCFENIERFNTQSTVILGFITPFIIVFGLFANALNFRIFTHKFMRVSLLNWYLAVLSLSDFLILITGFFFICLPRIGEYFEDYDVTNFSNTIVPLNYPLALIAQTASVWLTVLMSTHRFIGVCLPFKTAMICTKKNCRIALISVLVFAFLFNVSRFCEVTVVSCYSNIVNYTLIEPGITDLRRSDGYKTFYIVWCYFIVMFLLPFLLLIGLNTAVIVAIRNTSKLHHMVASGGDQLVVKKKKEIAKETSTSIMLVGVVIVFLICNTLAFVVNIFELIDSYYDEDNKLFAGTDFYHHMVDMSNVLVMLNASSNIFVYLSFSEKYRLLLKHYVTFSCFNDSEPLIDTTMTTHA